MEQPDINTLIDFWRSRWTTLGKGGNVLLHPKDEEYLHSTLQTLHAFRLYLEAEERAKKKSKG